MGRGRPARRGRRRAGRVLVPKVAGGADVARYDAFLAAAPQTTRLWAMIETARSLFRLEEIADAAAGTRLSAWVMGTNDLAKETVAQIRPGRAAFLGALGLAVAAARMARLTVLDGVFNGLEDDAGLEAECRQALEFGFDGKTLIHPRQVEIANRVFSPAPDEVAFARAVIAAFAEPQNAGKGALRVDGRMAERLHLAQAVKARGGGGGDRGVALAALAPLQTSPHPSGGARGIRHRGLLAELGLGAADTEPPPLSKSLAPPEGWGEVWRGAAATAPSAPLGPRSP